MSADAGAGAGGAVSALGCASASEACDVVDALLLSEVAYKRPNAQAVASLRAFHRALGAASTTAPGSAFVGPRVVRVQPTVDEEDAAGPAWRHPSHRYVLAESAGAVFVCFAGTKDFPRDAVADVRVGLAPFWAAFGVPVPVSVPVPVPGLDPAAAPANAEAAHAAHRGFLRRAAGVRIAPCVAYAAASGKRLVLCGHSMGGAVATLVSLAVLGSGHAEAAGVDLACVAFAMPPVVSPELAAYASRRGWAPRFAAYMLPEDLVPRLLGRAGPPASLGGVDLPALRPAYAHVGQPEGRCMFLEPGGARVPAAAELYASPQIQLRDPAANLRLGHSAALYRARVADLLRRGTAASASDTGAGTIAGAPARPLPELGAILAPPSVHRVGRGTLADGARVRLLVDLVDDDDRASERRAPLTGALVRFGDGGPAQLTRDVSVVSVVIAEREGEGDEGGDQPRWLAATARRLVQTRPLAWLLPQPTPPIPEWRSRVPSGPRWRAVVHASLPAALAPDASSKAALRATVTLLTDFDAVRPMAAVPLRRAKVLLVGAPGSGRTALWEALTGLPAVVDAGTLPLARELVHEASSGRRTGFRGLVTYVDTPGIGGPKALEAAVAELSGHASLLASLAVSSTGAPPEVLVLCHHMAHKVPGLARHAPPTLGALVAAAARQGVPTALALTHCFAASSSRRLALAAEVADAYGIPPSRAVLVNSLALEVGVLGDGGQPLVHPVEGVDALHDLVCRLVADRLGDPRLARPRVPRRRWRRPRAKL